MNDDNGQPKPTPDQRRIVRIAMRLGRQRGIVVAQTSDRLLRAAGVEPSADNIEFLTASLAAVMSDPWR